MGFTHFFELVAGIFLAVFNTDLLILSLRGASKVSAVGIVVMVSIVANAKVLLAFSGFSRLGLGRGLGLGQSDWVTSWIQRAEVPALIALSLIPLPGMRTACTAWCSANQSWPGLVAIMVANPIHILSVVWGWDTLVGLL